MEDGASSQIAGAKGGVLVGRSTGLCPDSLAYIEIKGEGALRKVRCVDDERGYIGVHRGKPRPGQPTLLWLSGRPLGNVGERSLGSGSRSLWPSRTHPRSTVNYGSLHTDTFPIGWVHGRRESLALIMLEPEREEAMCLFLHIILFLSPERFVPFTFHIAPPPLFLGIIGRNKNKLPDLAGLFRTRHVGLCVL